MRDHELLKHNSEKSIESEIKSLRKNIPLIVEKLALSDDMDISAWCNAIDSKLVPRFAPDFPLVASICGGGSSGKSTLFNALIQENISPTGGTAGINRRILIAGNSEHFSKIKNSFPDLFEPFGYRPEPLKDKHDLISTGNPLYMLSRNTPSNLILLDTPDFDTGSKGTYTNRDLARQALEVSDILIYIFTNANYNNRDNTDFISEMLTGIGTRKCFLVYRVYASYGTDEILEHAKTVAKNIYGDQATEQVLGVYRADEDNAVAADKVFLDLKAVKEGQSSLPDELANLDKEKIRLDLMASIIDDVADKARQIIETAKTSKAELQLYRNALQTWESHCVHSALQHFPMDIVLKRFVDIWHKTDPPHIKWMRKTGHVVEFPLRMIVKTAKWFGGKPEKRSYKEASMKHFSGKIEEDLLNAINNLWRKTVNSKLSVQLLKNDPIAEEMLYINKKIKEKYEGKNKIKPYGVTESANNELTFVIQAHPAIDTERNRLRSRSWEDTLESVMANKDQIIHISKSMENDLSLLVDHFRSRMNAFAKMRQTFSAFLNVLPATAAVTYILSTGDPVGAVGIKVKLAGLFGIKDLYALVAIPATTGLRKADQAQLQEMVGPIAKTWLNNKLDTIQMLFNKHITGAIIEKSNLILSDSDNLLKEIESTISE
jgi:hypothetical protein